MGFLHGVDNPKPSGAWSGAGWYGLTAISAVRAKAPGVFAKGQDGTLGI
jgi:hypothetical protein